MIETHSIKTRDWLLLALVLFVAALMRLGEPGIVPFFHDEAMLTTLAQDMAGGDGIPLTGINSSTGIPNPPQSVYLMALPFALGTDVQGATIFVMLWNVAGVGLLWLLAQRYFGRTVALVAGMTYALSPWAVLFSRKIWAQELHTPLILLALLLALYGFWETRRDGISQRIAQAVALPVLLFGLQIHFAAWALLPLYGLILVIGRRNIHRGALIVSLMLSVAVLLPYAFGLLETLAVDPTRISDAAARSDAADGLRLSADSLLSMIYLGTGFGLETWLNPAEPQQMLAAVPPVSLWSLVGLMMPVGAGLLLWRQRRWALLLLTWALFPALLLIPQWTPVYVHYFIASIPPLTLLAGVGVAGIARIVPLASTGRAIILASFGVMLITQGMYWRGLLRYLDTTPVPLPGFTTPLADLQAIADDLAAYDNVIVLSYGMSFSLHHESVVWPALLRDDVACVRTLIGDGYAVFPDGPFAVLVAPDAPPDPVGGLYTTGTPQIYETRPGETPYIVHVHESAPDGFTPDLTPVRPARFDNGATLTGYAYDGEQIWLEWQLSDGERGADYQVSAQLFDTDGERVGQRDTVFWHGRHWCAGDRLVQWFPLAAEAPPADLRVGLYQLTGDVSAPYAPATIIDEMGNPAGQQVFIPLP